MARGRKPQPTAVKEASGALRKDPQRRNKREPKPKVGHPAMPPTVKDDDVAAEQWKEICELLDEMNILTTADKSVLALYCTTYSEWLKSYQHVRNHGVRFVSKTGNATTSPETHQFNKLSDRMLKLYAELGLTPSSRSRIVVPGNGDDEESPFDSIVSRMRGSVN